MRKIVKKVLRYTARSYSSVASFNLGPYTGLERVNPQDNVYVAMSGGVDSSTVAALLTEKFGNQRVHGVYMNNWSSDSKCQERSWKSVEEISSKIGIACHRVDFERDYWADVFEPMLQTYQQGFTPNPDISCNHFIKFGKLISHLKDYDSSFKWIASGHYAGIDPQSLLVRRAGYVPKDQSYYLATVKQSALQHILLPLSSLAKPQVRDLAGKLNLGQEIACKPDSQGLCFVEQQAEVGQRGFTKFLSEYLTETPGPFVLASDPSVVVGEHKGLWTHTIGQRASVSLPQHLSEFRGQWFVVGKDIESNAMIIDRGGDSPHLYVDRLSVSGFNWYSSKVRPGPSVYAQYRSLQDPWKLQDWKINGSQTEFIFDQKRRAVAPGQYLVVYDSNVVVGAGIITSAA